jgi:hypothetical protein
MNKILTPVGLRVTFVSERNTILFMNAKIYSLRDSLWDCRYLVMTLATFVVALIAPHLPSIGNVGLGAISVLAGLKLGYTITNDLLTDNRVPGTYCEHSETVIFVYVFSLWLVIVGGCLAWFAWFAAK